MNSYLLEVKNLKKYFFIRGGVFWKEVGKVYAVDDVSFYVKEGETLGLVGESGCGKTTLGRVINYLYKPTYGVIKFTNIDLIKLKHNDLQNLRHNIQMIFQDPYESLNPRHTVEYILEEPFLIHKTFIKERKLKILDLLDKVGLPKNSLKRYPHEFSGGQRQRIGIARALALNPKLIICDEPVSALDVSIQSQIINLLLELQESLNLTYIFIAHDLSIVKHISDRVAVMYLGKIVELTDSKIIYSNPVHPYTKALISAIPIPDPSKKYNKIILKGEPPSSSNPPKGCRFHTRCPYVIDICKIKEPELIDINDNIEIEHLAACHRSQEIISGKI
ncbi:MAG: ATP-binding cassette domain-containing protein [Spirochaetes bacterium]|nr:ATP-binding cassette domain-containing protein [Spirochaetota bacterium]